MEFTIHNLAEYINILPDPCLVICKNEDETFRLVSYSSDAPRVFGIEDETFCDEKVEHAELLVYEQDRAEILHKFLRGFSTKSSEEYICRNIHTKEPYRWVRLKTSYPGTLEGNEICFVSLIAIDGEIQPEVIAAREHLAAIMRMNPNAMSTFRANLSKNTLSDGVSAYPNLLKLQQTNSFDGYVKDALEFFPFASERDEFKERFSISNLMHEFHCGHGQVSMKHHYHLTGKEDYILNTIIDMVQNRMTGDVEGIIYTLDVTEEMYCAKCNEALLDSSRIGIIVINVATGQFIVPQKSTLLELPVFYEEQDYEQGINHLIDTFVVDEEKENYRNCGNLSNIIKHLEEEGKYIFHSIWYKNGQLLNIRLSCYYTNDKKEQILGIAEDVTEVLKKEQEQITRYREALLQVERTQRDKNMLVTATQQMFPMCISANLTKNSYYMIEYDHFNTKKAARKGVFDELIQVGFETIHEEDQSEFIQLFSRKQLIKAYENGEKTVSMVHRQYGDDKKWHWNRTTVIFAESKPGEDIRQITLTDCLDEQKKTEDELKRKERELQRALEEARKANHAKSDFLSSMSHDIRTPLNAILNLCSLLRDELEEPEELEQDIQKMEVAGEFLLQLINDVLDVAAIESGKLVLAPRVYTYANFLNYIKGIIVPLCEEKDVTFVLDEGPTALDIYMDRVRFHQVFFNILSNAVKFTPPGGTVTFQTTNNVIHDGILTCDFIVTDTGCGMSQEFLNRIFEPFEREDTKNAYVGTGLGLTICKRILDLMGATISIESELGKGTKVIVHMDLQIATEEQKLESQAELDTSYHRQVELDAMDECRVLVVEDNRINREILLRLLEKKNFTVDCASNGVEAIEKIRDNLGDHYQAILMDVRMPIMDGLEATKRIREMEDEQKSHIPIIAITANAFKDDITECLEAGMNAYLSKPIAPNALYQMMATYIRWEMNPTSTGSE